MVKIKEVCDEPKKTTKWFKGSVNLQGILSETAEWTFTLFDWSVAGFMTLGKLVWWGTVLGFVVGIPVLMVKDTGDHMKKELKETEMNRQVHDQMDFDLGMGDVQPMSII